MPLLTWAKVHSNGLVVRFAAGKRRFEMFSTCALSRTPIMGNAVRVCQLLCAQLGKRVTFHRMEKPAFDWTARMLLRQHLINSTVALTLKYEKTTPPPHPPVALLRANKTCLFPNKCSRVDLVCTFNWTRSYYRTQVHQ